VKELTKRQKITGLILIIVIFFAGFYAGYEYRTQEFKNAITKAFSGISSDSNVSNPSTTKNDDGKQGHETVYHQLGDTIEFSTQKMKVNSVRTSTTITAQYGSPWVAQTGTKFIIVDLTVTNTGNSPITFEDFQLFDSSGKRYNASNESIGKIDNYLAVRELAPSVPETGVSVYVVPTGTNDFEFGGLNGKTQKIDVIKFSVQ
jgi:hypothetical protein